MLTLLPVRKTGLNNRKKESVDLVRHSDLAWHVLGECVCKPESKLFLLKNAKKGVSKKSSLLHQPNCVTELLDDRDRHWCRHYETCYKVLFLGTLIEVLSVLAPLTTYITSGDPEQQQISYL